MTQNLTYQEYITTRSENIKRTIEGILLSLTAPEDLEFVLEEALEEYRMIAEQKALDLYHSVNLYPESYEVETSTQKIKDQHVKRTVQDIFFELDLLYQTISDLTGTADAEREETSLEEILSNIEPTSRTEIEKTLKYYETLYQTSIKYLGSGESCTAFQVGSKVIKLGAMRQYDKIPFCLPIEHYIPYGRNKYMFVTDKINTGEATAEDVQHMYNSLRNSGFVWLDAKPDNIGSLNGTPKILDDIDIYTEEDLLSIKGGTVLEYVSYSSQIALQELNWLSTKDPNFDINNINRYYRNQSPKTQENIEAIKDEYRKHHATYQYNTSTKEFEDFNQILRNTIDTYNQMSSEALKTAEQPSQK